MTFHKLLRHANEAYDAGMLDPAPEQVTALMNDAHSALTRSDSQARDVMGEPILIVPDVMSHIRLPKLIPDDCRPNLTAMIMKAVEQDRV